MDEGRLNILKNRITNTSISSFYGLGTMIMHWLTNAIHIQIIRIDEIPVFRC